MIVWFVTSGVLIAVIASSSLWWVSTRLATTEKSAIFDIEEATDFVADRLPLALQNVLSYEEVQVLLLWHLDFLRSHGLVTYGEGDETAQAAALGGRDVIAAEEDAVDALIDRAAREGVDFSELDIVSVVDLTGDYLERIGAFGHRRILSTGESVAPDPGSSGHRTSD